MLVLHNLAANVLLFTHLVLQTKKKMGEKSVVRRLHSHFAPTQLSLAEHLFWFFFETYICAISDNSERDSNIPRQIEIIKVLNLTLDMIIVEN